MKHNLPARKLREHPDLNQIKRQAKELLQAFLAGEADAIEEVKAHYRGADPWKFALHEAQLALARSVTPLEEVCTCSAAADTDTDSASAPTSRMKSTLRRDAASSTRPVRSAFRNPCFSADRL